MQQDLNRRRFLGAAAGTGAAIAAGGAIAPAAVARKGGGSGDRGKEVPHSRIGIQLYSLREAMTNQQEATAVLTALAEMGYAEVETAGHYGWTAAQFRSLLDS